MIFRLFFFLLVFANLAFFAWTRGYLGGTDETREPQRLTQQLNADKLRIVHDASADATNAAALVCRAVNGLTTSAAADLIRVVGLAGGKTELRQQQAMHRLVVPALANKIAADKKLAELHQLGVNDVNALALPDGRYEIVLASFDNETAARTALVDLTKRGVRLVQWEKPGEKSKQARLAIVEIQAPAAVLASRLPEWIAPYATVTVSECVR